MKKNEPGTPSSFFAGELLVIGMSLIALVGMAFLVFHNI
jgi:hypothetical protein